MNSFRENRSGGALLHSYLQEYAPPSTLHKGKLNASKRKKANAALRHRGFDGNTRFRSTSQGVSEVAGVLQDYGIEVDEPVTADRFRRPTGSASFRVAHSNPEEPMAPQQITNSMIVFQWTELRSGFEILAYLS